MYISDIYVYRRANRNYGTFAMCVCVCVVVLVHFDECDPPSARVVSTSHAERVCGFIFVLGLVDSALSSSSRPQQPTNQPTGRTNPVEPPPQTHLYTIESRAGIVVVVKKNSRISRRASTNLYIYTYLVYIHLYTYARRSLARARCSSARPTNHQAKMIPIRWYTE